MALQAAYKQFLAAPNSSFLAADASLHYITSTTSFSGATEIIKHFATLRNQIKKKKETFLNVVEGADSIAVEAEAAFEFVSSGGPFLPGLDDNFLSDRTVLLPVIHLVTFDADGKIAQIRQSWDQGSLLKQLEVIGRSGRNWPIRDSKDQLALLAKSINSKDGASAEGPEQQLPARSRGNSTNILRDPHASLSLFAPRDDPQNLPSAVVSPYAGNRPRQRSFTEILGDEPQDDEEGDSPSRGRSQSPSKAIAPKVGAGKNFQPIRLFDADENAPPEPDSPEMNQSPERFYRPNPKKYEHFDFADGSDPQDAPGPGAAPETKSKSKHDSNWSFDDFVTPQKPTATRGLHRARDVRHWGTAEDDGVEETPVGRVQIKPRRDAETHFELQDDGLPSDEPRITRPRGATHNTNLGLYKNNLYREDGSAPTPGPHALDTVTNLKDRRKDFDAHFEITDESPHHGNGNGNTKANAKVGENRQKAVRMMESNWGAYDKSPAPQKENNNPAKKPDERGITIAGDGMGGRKGTGRGWAIGDESDEEQGPRPPPKKQPAAAAKSSFWDF